MKAWLSQTQGSSFNPLGSIQCVIRVVFSVWLPTPLMSGGSRHFSEKNLQTSWKMFQVSLDSLAVVLKRSLQPTNSISITRDLFTNANLRFYSRPTESETLGCGPAICVLTNHPRDSDTHSCMRSMALGPQIIFSHLQLPMKLLTSSPNFLHKLFSQHFFKNVHLFYELVLSIFSCIHSLSERSKFFGISITWNHITQRLSSSLQTHPEPF